MQETPAIQKPLQMLPTYGDICQSYLEGKKCEMKQCNDRHPKVWKYWSKSKAGCRREGFCDFLHVTLACDDERTNNAAKVENQTFKCVGCEDSWKDERCVVTHNINDQWVHFCLNCDDWVKDKSKVLDENWTLFDNEGNLRYDIWRRKTCIRKQSQKIVVKGYCIALSWFFFSWWVPK